MKRTSGLLAADSFTTRVNGLVFVSAIVTELVVTVAVRNARPKVSGVRVNVAVGERPAGPASRAQVDR